MTKRFLLTFVLTLIILMTYQFFFFKPPKRKPTVRQTADTSNAAVKGDTVKKPFEEIIKEEKPYVVISPLYEAHFSRTGGLLISYSLKKFNGKDGGALQLIPEGSGLFDVATKNIHWLHCPFTADIETLFVDSAAELRLVGVSNGDTLVKIFKFWPDSYLIGFSLVPRDTYRLLFPSGLKTTEKDRKDDLKYFSLVYFRNKLRKVSLGSLRKKTFTDLKGSLEWAGIRTKYFLFAVIPMTSPFSGLRASASDSRISFEVLSTDTLYKAYFGPIDYFILKEVGYGLAQVYDFGAPIISIFSRLILFAFKFLYRYTSNYGWVIVIFALLMKLVFWPFTVKNLRSMKKMQELNPKLNALRKMYRDDPEKLQQEMMELYRKHKVNPFSGCLMLLLQLPIFWGLYKILRTTIDLRGAPFILWIHDLSQKDPYYVLPILMGLVSIAQSLMQPAQDQQSKMFAVFMPIFLTFIFLNFPSGIVLYWLTYNVLSLVEQLWLRRTS